MNDMALIVGQRPVKTRARNSIATFKLREGQPVGIAVTLRGNVRMSLNTSCFHVDFLFVSVIFQT